MKLKTIITAIAFFMAITSCSSEEATMATFDYKPFQPVGNSALSVGDFFNNPFFLRMNTITGADLADFSSTGKTPLFFLITSTNIPNKTYCFSSFIGTQKDGLTYATIDNKVDAVTASSVQCSTDSIPFQGNDDASFSISVLATDANGVGPFINQLVKNGLAFGIYEDDQTGEQTANIYDVMDLAIAMHKDILLSKRPELIGFFLADALPNGTLDIASNLTAYPSILGLTIDKLIPVATAELPNLSSALTLVFDGDGKTISGFSRKAPADMLPPTDIANATTTSGFGLFPVVSGGMIKDLNLKLNGDVVGSVEASKVVPTGALVGAMRLGSSQEPSILENVSIDLNGFKVATAQDVTGGAVGSFFAANGAKMDSVSVSNGSVISNGGSAPDSFGMSSFGVGGVVGFVFSDDTRLTLENISTSNVMLKAAEIAGGTAGIVMLNQRTDSDASFLADKLKVVNSTITTTNGEAGGLFGVIAINAGKGEFATPVASNIKQSFVLDTLIDANAVLTAGNTGSFFATAGGLVGRLKLPSLTISDSYVNGSKGKVQLKTTGAVASQLSPIGGLVGQVKFDSATYPKNSKLTITNSYANVAITPPAGVSPQNNFAGGILGNYYNYPGSLPTDFDGTGVLSVNNGYGLAQNLSDSTALELYAKNSGLGAGTATASAMLDGATQMKCQDLTGCKAVFVGFNFENVWADPTKPQAANNQGSPALLLNPTN